MTEKETINDEEYMQKMWAQCCEEMSKHADECERINNRIFKAIENQIGKGFLADLKALIEDSECRDDFKIVDEPKGKFQKETDFGCIVGVWIVQYAQGMEGDSWAGTITVKLKDYKYLEMPFSC